MVPLAENIAYQRSHISNTKRRVKPGIKLIMRVDYNDPKMLRVWRKR